MVDDKENVAAESEENAAPFLVNNSKIRFVLYNDVMREDPGYLTFHGETRRYDIRLPQGMNRVIKIYGGIPVGNIDQAGFFDYELTTGNGGKFFVLSIRGRKDGAATLGVEWDVDYV